MNYGAAFWRWIGVSQISEKLFNQNIPSLVVKSAANIAGVSFKTYTNKRTVWTVTIILKLYVILEITIAI